MEVELMNRRSKVATMRGRAFVNETLVAEAEFMAGVVDKPKSDSQ